ncbi:MAG: ribokinase [Candidatus Microgenomates bacterium]
MAKILAIGEIVFDQFIFLNNFPNNGEKITAQNEINTLGGTVALMSLLFKKLNNQVILYGNLGIDNEGIYLSEFVRRVKIDFYPIIQPKTLKNIILIDSQTKKRTIIKRKFERRLIDIGQIDLNHLKNADIIVVDRHHLHLFSFINENKKKEALFLFDPSTQNNVKIVNFLKMLTINIIPIEFLELKKNDQILIKEKVKKLFGELTTIVTANGDGVYLFDKKNSYQLPAIDINPVDVTGAGDVFRAAFLNNYYKNKNLVESTIFANIVAGLQCSRIGSGSAIPSKKEINNFLLKNPIKSYLNLLKKI